MWPLLARFHFHLLLRVFSVPVQDTRMLRHTATGTFSTCTPRILRLRLDEMQRLYQ